MKIAQTILGLALLQASNAFVAPGLSNARGVSTRIFEEVEADTEIRGAAEISGLTGDVEAIFDTEEVDAAIPHRYPFNFVDKIVEYVPGKRAVGIKMVSKNEDFFNGHFPGRRVMPGVLQVEALAQLAGTICLKMDGADPGSIFFFAGVDGVKWKKPVVPGDALVMEVEILKFNKKFGLVKATGKAFVDGKVAIEVKEMTFALAK
uniref:Beta-hydroxyacyl-ACP dehydratase n=1 Tax=Entomoneis paludosa TaxID=265537 RepID=A0A7S2VGY6_9STRA|mmetsp:Transcript_18437/g.38105  ORF Transcript_18437/g.38105 Transcript_18437/m.38105 type:complete len:205 (+) Transcript_18437:118-732(+)